MHFHLDHTVALAGFAAAALYIEGEASRPVTARAGLRYPGKEFADGREQPGVGRRVGAWGAADGALVDVDDLVEVLQAVEAVVGRHLQGGRAIERRGSDREQRVVDQRRLARAGYAGDAGQQPHRDLQIDVTQVVAAGALELEQLFRVATGAFRWVVDRHPAGEVLAGQGVRVRHHLVGGALGDDAATVHPGPRADVHHVVGKADGVLVMLDHDHRVADVAQVTKGAQQALVVALVQADRGLIEDVHHTDQAGADLARQSDALGLAAGQRVRTAVEGQVVEADIDQELQTLADLLENLVGDFAATTAERESAEIIGGVADGQCRDRRQCLVANPHVASLAAQAGAAAFRAGLSAEVLRQLFAHRSGLGLAVAAFEVGDDAFERMRAPDDVPTVIEVTELDVLPAASAQDELLMLGGQRVEGLVQTEPVMRGQRAEHLEIIDVAPVPAADRTFGQGELAVDQALGIEELLHAQAIAGRAGTCRVVEGEQLGFQLADGVTADRAGEACGEDHLLAFFVLVHGRDQRDAVRQFQRRLEGFGQTLLQVAANLEAIHHDIDGVLLLFVQLGQFVQLVEAAVDAGANEALGPQLVEHGQVLALSLANDGCQQHQLAPFWQRQDLVDHLTDGLRFQRRVMVRAAWCADPRVEQAQVIVDLGDGADGGARVV